MSLFCTHAKVEGVFKREFDSLITEKSRIGGHGSFLLPIKSSRMITTATPDGPTFFCVQKSITPNCRKFFQFFHVIMASDDSV